MMVFLQCYPTEGSAILPEAAVSPLVAWESFYVIVGSSGAALTGLQFVVMALAAEGRAVRGSDVGVFGTPTIVHFCVVLMLSAILSAPWDGLFHPSVLLGACGAVGMAYVGFITRRAGRHTNYKPVLEDWIWHSALPLVAYLALLLAAIRLQHHTRQSLFILGGTALLLLLDGIHNAWDTVTFMAIQQSQKPES
jgi:hypothetical protein